MSIITNRTFFASCLAHFQSVKKLTMRGYAKDSVIMSKLLSKGNKKKSWKSFTEYEAGATMPQPATLSQGPAGNKRVVVLNKLFMKHITDLMATGKNAESLAGLGIEVTKIKVGRDYNVVNVYWTSHGHCSEEEVNATLRRAAGDLRRELTGLRVIGKVPLIQFVRDRSVGSWASVEAILGTLDLGPDYVPTGMCTLKSEFNNQTRFQDENRPPVEKDCLPPMRQDVFGLNREAILGRLSSSVMAKRKMEVKCPVKVGAVDYVPFDQNEFSQFLLKRRILREKMLRAEEREAYVCKEEDEKPDAFEEEVEDDFDFIDEDEEDRR